MDSKISSHNYLTWSKQAAYNYHQIFLLQDFEKVLLGQYLILRKNQFQLLTCICDWDFILKIPS